MEREKEKKIPAQINLCFWIFNYFSISVAIVHAVFSGIDTSNRS